MPKNKKRWRVKWPGKNYIPVRNSRGEVEIKRVTLRYPPRVWSPKPTGIPDGMKIVRWIADEMRDKNAFLESMIWGRPTDKEKQAILRDLFEPL